MDLLFWMQGAGVLLGLSGTVISTAPTYASKLAAFRIWAVSNSIMLMWAMVTAMAWFVLLYGAYTGMAVLGLYRDRREVQA